jgi:signal transduction histidine kinase
LVPRSLRAQLTLAIVVVTAFAVGLSFVALYRGTGARLRDEIDSDLEAQLAAWDGLRAGQDLSTPTDVAAIAQRYIGQQSYLPASRVFVVDVAGGQPVTNNPRVLGDEPEDEAEDDRELRDSLTGAPDGLATVDVEDLGEMRVATQAIEEDGRRVGTLHVADPLASVERAETSLTQTFVVVGAIALLLAVVAGSWISTLIARPLSRMARVASAVDAGDMSLRVGSAVHGGEVGVLADAFDRMLERLERTFMRQRDFVSDASHELRTPLAVLRGQVELLDRETDEAARHDAAALLLRRLDELDRLVGDMLTLANAEAGRLVSPQPIELDDFFEDLRRDLPLFGEREFTLHAVGGTLDADPDRLTQVLRNLVRNAVAHTSPGDRIDVAATGRAGWLHLTVHDSGPGIAPDQLERVFERFYRTDAGRSRDSGGSGLGLAIARAIVEAHGGRIRAESAPGAGATFRIDLPGYHGARPR